jgi:hypothetical protein
MILGPPPYQQIRNRGPIPRKKTMYQQELDLPLTMNSSIFLPMIKAANLSIKKTACIMNVLSAMNMSRVTMVGLME